MKKLVAVLAMIVLVGCSVMPSPSAPAPSQVSSAPSASPSPSASPTPAPDPALWVQRENALPGDPSWRIAKVASASELAGFVDRVGVKAGEKLTLKATTTSPTFTVEAFRLGYYQGHGGRKVWSSTPLQGTVQAPVKVLAGNMVSAAHWTPSGEIDTTGWPEGAYVLKLSTPSGLGKWIPVTVLSQDFKDKVLFLNATTTWQAYNEYGGYSLYKGPKGFGDRSRRVSFDRPYDGYGARHLWGYEWSIIYIAEREGINLAYATSAELEAGASAFAGLRGIISTGHDEYWSVPMRDTAEALRDSGTNLAFLGANAVYWRVRFADHGRVIEGYKSATEDPVAKDPTTTALWRHGPSPRPESSLVGMLYECYPANGDLVVYDPGFFLFAGTGVKAGTKIKALVGVEIDRAYPGALAPKGLQVVAHSPVACGKQKTFSDMTYYTVESGAGVFSVGTMNWGPQHGLDEDGKAFVSTVTANLVKSMAEGPMGAKHPAVGNLAAVKPPANTNTGTGGAVAQK